MKNKIIIIGAGDLGRQILHHLKSEENAIVIGWLDDTFKKGEVIDGVEVLGAIHDFKIFDTKTKFIVAIGYSALIFKNKLVNQLKNEGRQLYTFIHPSAIIDSTAIIEEGVIIYPGCIIDMNAIIKSGVLLNNGVIVSHDSMVNESSFIAPGVTIAGNVVIGKNCFIGLGSTIKDGVKITNEVITGSGANIFKDIKYSGTYTDNIKLKKH